MQRATISGLVELSDLLTSIARFTHSPLLYEEMGRRAGVDVPPRLFTVLARIRELAPVRITEVADTMDADRSTVSRQIAELVDLGCVARRADPDDGRATVVSLTTTGERAITKVFDVWLEALGASLDGWSNRDRATLTSLLRRLDATLRTVPG